MSLVLGFSRNTALPPLKVTYGAWNFIEKNADRLHRDLVGLLSESSNPLAAKLFQEEAEAPEDPRKTRRHPSISAQFKKQARWLWRFAYFFFPWALHMTLETST